MDTEILTEVAYAIGIGLAIGLEREHSDIEKTPARADADAASEAAGPERVAEATAAPARHGTGVGARTLALTALLGWLVAYLSATWFWLPVVGFAAIAMLVALQYLRERDIGMTTEVAALIVFVLGMLVRDNRPLAVALALGTTLLLVSKPWILGFVARMRRVELTATLQLLILLAIVLPMLPDEPVDPWEILPPRKIGLFVVLIGGIGYVGYVLTRILGRRRSAGLTGVVGGLTSSTAVTVSMAQQARAEHGMRLAGQMSVFLANAMMFPRVLLVTALLSTTVAAALAPPLVAMGLVMLGGAVWKWRAMSRETGHTGTDKEPPIKNPFALLPALTWGAILCAVLVLAHFAHVLLGDSGVLVAALASGLADVDAITLAVTSQASQGTLGAGTASLAISIAIISNTVVKGTIAVVAGGRSFGRDVVVIFAASMAAGGLIALRVLF